MRIGAQRHTPSSWYQPALTLSSEHFHGVILAIRTDAINAGTLTQYAYRYRIRLNEDEQERWDKRLKTFASLRQMQVRPRGPESQPGSLALSRRARIVKELGSVQAAVDVIAAPTNRVSTRSSTAMTRSTHTGS